MTRMTLLHWRDWQQQHGEGTRGPIPRRRGEWQGSQAHFNGLAGSRSEHERGPAAQSHAASDAVSRWVEVRAGPLLGSGAHGPCGWDRRPSPGLRRCAQDPRRQGEPPQGGRERAHWPWNALTPTPPGRQVATYAAVAAAVECKSARGKPPPARRLPLVWARAASHPGSLFSSAAAIGQAMRHNPFAMLKYRDGPPFPSEVQQAQRPWEAPAWPPDKNHPPTIQMVPCHRVIASDLSMGGTTHPTAARTLLRHGKPVPHEGLGVLLRVWRPYGYPQRAHLR
jgi:hypothetical protein